MRIQNPLKRVVAALCVATLIVGCGGTATDPDATEQLTLQFESPEEGGVFEQLPIEVAAALASGDRTASLRLEIGGRVLATAENASRIEGVIDALEPGTHTVTFTATEANGDPVVVERILTFMAPMAPEVTLTSPREDTATPVRRIQVQGTVTDNVGVEGATLRVGEGEEVALELGADGSFTATFTPTPGTNAFTVTAWDAAGNENAVSSHVYFGHRISVGNSQVAVLIDGLVHTWGRNENGQIGDGTLIKTLDNYPEARFRHEALPGIVSVVTRQTFVLALHEDGRVFSWGGNGDGQLGYATPADCGSQGTTPCGRVPQQVPGISTAVAIAAGFDHSLILLEDGTVLSFGDNTKGQLGDGTDVSRAAPQPVPGLTSVIQLAAGAASSMALTAEGTVYVWGSNSDGFHGAGTDDSDAHPVPQVVAGVEGAVELAAGNYTPLVRLADGTVKAWGRNNNGQVGNGDIENQDALVPTQVLTELPLTTDTPAPLTGIESIAADGFVSLALTPEGRVWAWGMGSMGQLGLGFLEDGERDLGNRRVATLVPFAEEDLAHLNVVEIDVGAGGPTLIRTREGELYAWGWSFQGNFGLPDVLAPWAYTSPVRIHPAE